VPLCRRLVILALAGGGLAATTHPGLAQQRRVDLFVTLALGSGSMDLSGLVSGTLQTRHWALTLRTTGNLPPAGEPVATDLGLLLGYADTRRHWRTALGAGVALVETGDSSRTYGSPFNGRSLFGVPIQAELFWRPARGIGLGAVAVGQINADRSFWSLLCGLQLGRFE
jgi:hypothetical protein